MQNVVVIGAGLSGLSAALHLKKYGYNCYVFEKEKKVGGLCRTNEVNGYFFDYAGHWFHSRSKYIKTFIEDLMAGSMQSIIRKTGIYMLERYIGHPFQSNLKGLPQDVIIECLIEFSKSYYSSNKEYSNFEEWVVCNLGKGIARHFMLPYNKKLWTVNPKDMTCDWMGRFVPSPDIKDVFIGALGSETKGEGYNATFAYPESGGIQSLADKLRSRLDNIFLGHELESIDVRKHKVKFTNGNVAEYDILINTIPLNRLVSIIANKDHNLNCCRDLFAFNALYNINLGVKNANMSGMHWIYYPEDDIPFFRLGSYSNAISAMAPGGKSSLYIEVAYKPEIGIDYDMVQEKCLKKLVDIGIIGSENDIEVVQANDIECAYVIYDKNHKELSRGVKDYLKRNGIYSIGRYGNWEYSSMEDALLQGAGIINHIDANRREFCEDIINW